jgi:hypothetical protein
MLGMNSAFALRNGHLDLGQIAAKRLSTAQFAFLSVCHAAAGVRAIPERRCILQGDFKVLCIREDLLCSSISGYDST